jgi:hypothetical protein
MKFSEMLGEPDPARETPEEPEPISVFAPVPTTPPPTSASWVDDPATATWVNDTPTSTWVDENAVPPEPVTPENPSLPGPAMPAPPLAPRSGLAEVNVLSPSTAPTQEVEPVDELTGLAGLTVVDDDLLPSARRSRK